MTIAEISWMSVILTVGKLGMLVLKQVDVLRISAFDGIYNLIFNVRCDKIVTRWQIIVLCSQK